MSERHDLMDQLIRHESLRLKPYMDSVGKITIGVGRNLSDVGITTAEAMVLLENDINDVLADLRTFDWFPGLDAVRRRVLVDMRFNLGPSRFRGFKAMLRYVSVGEYELAAKAMRNSLWAKQVKTRADRLIVMMRTGRDDQESHS
jgi:lysozyme